MKIFYCKLGVFLTTFFLVNGLAFSQTPLPGAWTFNQGCNGFSGACTGAGVTVGPAGTYRMTEFGSLTTTTMWNNTVYQMSKPWTLNFEINFGNHATTATPPEGGEGIAFVMQSINGSSGNTNHITVPPAAALTAGGYGGGDLGIKCGQSGGASAFPPNNAPANQRAISVEFDVFNNTSGVGCTGGCIHPGDIAADHIGVNYDDCSANSSNSTLGAAVQALPGGAPMRDGVWRAVSVVWTPNAPVIIGSKYDRYVQATGVGSCLDAGSFVDACGNTVLWSSTTCGANRNCDIMAVNTGTLTVSYNGVVKQNVVLNLETLLNANQGVNGTNIPRDFIFGFTASTEGKTNYQAIRNPIILPVEFVDFNLLKTSNSSVDVKWYTASEKNSDYFVVQRSIDGKTWMNIGKVKAAGNSQAFAEYTFSDFNLAQEVYYYRIEETDFDGTKMYSNIKTVSLKDEAPVISIYPNPADANVTINFSGEEKSFSVELYESNGVLLYSSERVQGNSLTIDTQEFAAGVYFVKIISGSNTSVQKLIVY